MAPKPDLDKRETIYSICLSCLIQTFTCFAAEILCLTYYKAFPGKYTVVFYDLSKTLGKEIIYLKTHQVPRV